MSFAPRMQASTLRNTAKVRCQMVVRGYWRELFALPSGEVGELTLVWGSRNAWKYRREARGTGWRTLAIGPFVLAYRIQV